MILDIDTREESTVKDGILKMLEDEEEISLHDNLFLDSLNYFTTRRFRESVILSNTVLEVFVRNLIAERLKQEGQADQDIIRKVNKIFKGKFTNAMKESFFKDLDTDSLNKHPIWKKFVRVRKKRTIAIHPYTTKHGRIMYKLEGNDAREVIHDIFHIIGWINQNYKRMPTSQNR
jgi:hypothetical protein